MNPEEMKKKIYELDGDIYLMSQTIKAMNNEITDLKARYELLLNRVKCTECHLNKSGDNNG